MPVKGGRRQAGACICRKPSLHTKGRKDQVRHVACMYVSSLTYRHENCNSFIYGMPSSACLLPTKEEPPASHLPTTISNILLSMMPCWGRWNQAWRGVGVGMAGGVGGINGMRRERQQGVAWGDGGAIQAGWRITTVNGNGGNGENNSNK